MQAVGGRPVALRGTHLAIAVAEEGRDVSAEGLEEAWIGWPVDRAAAGLAADGRRVLVVATGEDMCAGAGARLVLSVRDPGPPQAVTLIATWVPGAAAAAWAGGGGTL